MKKLAFLLFISNVLCVINAKGGGAPAITKMLPREGGYGGRTKLTIFGRNFADDKFSFGRGRNHLGNEVTLIGKSVSSVACRVSKQHSTTRLIVCYTPTRHLVADTKYYVRVKVNGVQIPNKNICGGRPFSNTCSFTARRRYTPTIETMDLASGKPGLKIRICGRIFSTRFGMNSPPSINGRTENIVRVYAPGECKLRKDDSDDLYELFLESQYSEKGCFTCKAKTTFVGNANVSFSLEPNLGSSVPLGHLLKLSSTGEIYMIQYYTEITSQSHHIGSMLGGLRLRVYVDYFELGGSSHSSYALAKVYVGETECLIVDSVKDSYVECEVAAQPPPEDTPSIFMGERGVEVMSWPDGEFSDLQALKNALPTDNKFHFDKAEFCGHEINKGQTSMRGIFSAPKSGTYSFQVKASYSARLYVDGIPQGDSSGGWSSGADLELLQGHKYEIIVVAMGPSAKPSANTDRPCVIVKANLFTEDRLTSSWTENVIQDTQIIRLTSTPTPERQVIRFTAGTKQSSAPEVQKVCVLGSFFEVRLGMFDCFTGVVRLDEVLMVQTALNSLPVLDRRLDPVTYRPAEYIIVEPYPYDSRCIIVKIFSARGNFPNLQIEVDGESGGSVTEEIPGQPDNDLVSLMIGNRPSTPFRLSELQLIMFAAAMNSMFEAVCPLTFSFGSIIFEDFENERGGYNVGTVDNKIEPFCGRQSIRRPWRIYPFTSQQTEIELRFYQTFYVCFAYSGMNDPRLVFKYRNENGQEIWSGINVMSLQAQTEGNIWDYSCVSLKEGIGSGVFIEARLYGTYVKEFYLDALYFGLAPTILSTNSNQKISEMRLRPASPNHNERVLIDHVETTYDSTTREYTVTLYPLYCGHDFDLFQLLNNKQVEKLP